MRFHKTTNVPYQMVYDSDTGEEYTDMYSMLADLNELARDKTKLEQKLAKTEAVFTEFKLRCDAESDRDSTKIKNLEAALKVYEKAIEIILSNDPNSKVVYGINQICEQAQQKVKEILKSERK